MEGEKPDQRNEDEEVELNEDDEVELNNTIDLGQHAPFPESYLEFLCEIKRNDEDLQTDNSCYGITTDQQRQQTAVTNSPLYSVPPYAANPVMNGSNLFINTQRLVWLISIKE